MSVHLSVLYTSFEQTTYNNELETTVEVYSHSKALLSDARFFPQNFEIGGVIEDMGCA